MTHKLDPLPYDYNALEPYIDEQTMRIHHGKHHQAYVDKLNAVVQGTSMDMKSIEELLMNLNTVPENIRTAVANHGGGHFNHSIWWPMLAKDITPKGDAIKAIDEQFGSFDKFKEQFSNAAITLFGSGWAWLVMSNGKMEIVQTQNQDSPISSGKTPLLTIDVWEHAYYLKWKNQRNKYVETFWNVVNWQQVEENYKKAMKK